MRLVGRIVGATKRNPGRGQLHLHRWGWPWTTFLLLPTGIEHQPNRKEVHVLATAKYYSPRLDRDLISPLYHAAKCRRIPMTRLASTLIRGALAGLPEHGNLETAIVREEPPAPDPRGPTP